MLNARKLSLLVAAALAACAAIAPGAQASWSSASFTLPTTTSQGTGSACVSTTFCVLTGTQSGGTTRGLTYKYNGSTYTSVAPSSTTFEPYGVGCNSATFCMAVGPDFAGTTPAGHAEKFNGTSWSTVTTANPTGSIFTELRGVACPGAAHCVAAGRSQTPTTNTALVETYNGTAFSQTAVTPPAGTTSAELNAVACSSSTACTAVGLYTTASGTSALVFRYNGTTWSTQTPAVPAGATYSELDGVSCPGISTCQAVGYYQDSASVYHSLAQSWNGSTWANRSVADPTGGESPGLASVSCWSTTACEAVGSYTDSTNLNVEKLAAAFNGSAWSLQSVPRPMSVSDAQLTGVGCVSATFCRAAGISIYDGTTTVTGQRPAIDVGP